VISTTLSVASSAAGASAAGASVAVVVVVLELPHAARANTMVKARSSASSFFMIFLLKIFIKKLLTNIKGVAAHIAFCAPRLFFILRPLTVRLAKFKMNSKQKAVKCQ
jgi:hypothetical protein